MKASLGIDFDTYVSSPVAFDYERMMADTGFTLDDIARIQAETKVGGTPLHELTRLTEAVRAFAGPGKGARILVKDEAANASGSLQGPPRVDQRVRGEEARLRRASSRRPAATTAPASRARRRCAA